MFQNYYEILGVASTANTDEIRKAFRAKAKLLHPDVSSAPNANEKFRQVNEAYEVLTDVQRRYLFDLQLGSLLQKEQARKVHPKTYGSAKTRQNFHYDWESISRAAYARKQQKEREEENYLFRATGTMLQFLYVFGMFMGFVVTGITVWAIWLGFWPAISVLAATPGIFMVKEGWQGITGQETWLSSIFGKKK